MMPVVLLLAGGKSERFWPLSDKNLMPMLGKPLIQWQIENLVKLGFKDIIVVGNKDISDWFFSSQPNKLLNNHKYTINIRFVLQRVDKTLSGMAGAILTAYELYQKMYKDKPIYILNANDFYRNDLHEKILKTADRVKTDVLIAAYRLKQYLPMGYLRVNGDRITGIIEKPLKGKEPSDLVNIVAHWYRHPEKLFSLLKVEPRRQPRFNLIKSRDDLYEQAMAKLMKTQRFSPVIYQGEWCPLKYPWHLLDVMNFFLKNLKTTLIDKTAKVSPKATIVGPVVLEKGVRVFENAKIVGPCFIGSNSIIGDHSLVRESMIGQNCVVGFSSDITRSYLGDDCWTHTNYIGDSILEKNINLGSGAVTANLRLDEQNIHSLIKEVKTDSDKIKLGTIIGQRTRIGVNASIMPGIKIGANCAVGSNVVVNRDLLSGKMCLLDQKTSITDNKYQPCTSQRDSFMKKI